MRKPFFRSQTRTWYVKDANGKQIRLGNTRDEAYAAWHNLASGTPAPKVVVPVGTTVGDIIAECLDWTKERRSDSTYEWLRHYLAGRDDRPKHAFGQRYGHLLVSDLTPDILETWIDEEFAKASENGRCGAKRAVMRCFNWAVKYRKKLVPENPLAGAEVSAKVGGTREASYQPRQSYLSPEQWAETIAAVPADDWLHDFMMFLRETGCRPHEARILESRHFVRKLGLFVIPKDEAKGKKRDRTIPLNTAALAIANRLSLKYPTGTLFRNRSGKQLTRNMIHGRLHTLSKRLGFHIHAYVLRRSFVTDALANGLTADVLRAVTGHTTTAMIDTVYSALERKADTLRAAVKRATGEVA